MWQGVGVWRVFLVVRTRKGVCSKPEPVADVWKMLLLAGTVRVPRLQARRLAGRRSSDTVRAPRSPPKHTEHPA